MYKEIFFFKESFNQELIYVFANVSVAEPMAQSLTFDRFHSWFYDWFLETI